MRGIDNPLVEFSKNHWRIELPGGGEIKGDNPDEVVSGVSNTVNRELSNAGNSVNSAVNQATGGASWEDILINSITGGFVGYGDGGLRAGALTRGFAEGIGELTGANAARDANNMARNLLAEQRAEAARLREEELARLRRNDVSASRAAGRSQRAAFYGAGSGLGADSGAFNNLTRDFLGL